jgi:hypothetical protein
MSSSPKLPVHNSIREKLDKFHASKRVPHILFYGHSGSGKKVLVDEFLRKIYNNDNNALKTNVKYVNCAHGKGIKFIREDLRFFAKTNVHLNGGFSFKTVILMNADSLTADAQSALRRCIEIYSDNTRFFIIVQNKHKLLQPILSRFCDIHVPHPFINGEPVNLYKWNAEKAYPFISTLTKEKQELIEKMYQSYSDNAPNNQITHSILTELVLELYENAISSYDIVSWIRNGTRWSELEKANGLICFSKVKSEYRCEQLLMFYLFDFMQNRSTMDLSQISFI